MESLIMKFKKKKLKQGIILSILSLVFLISIINVSAVLLSSGTNYYSTANITLNITQDTYCDLVSIDSNGIYLVNCNLDNSNNGLTYNLTTINKIYNSSTIPYFTNTDVNNKQIYSPFSINSTVNLAVLSCDSVGTITYTSASGSVTNYVNSLFQTTYPCQNNIVTLTVQLDTGTNTFSINNGDRGALTACDSSLQAFLGYVALLGLVGTVFFLSLALMWVFNIGNKSTISSVLTIGSVVSIIMVGILIIIAIFIFSSLCTLV